MKKLFCLIIVLTSYLNVQGADYEQNLIDCERVIIKEIFPEKFEQLETIRKDKNSNGAEAVIIILQLIDSSKKLLASLPNERKNWNAYIISWAMGIHLYSQTEDQSQKKRLLDEWNKHLQKSKYANFQIMSLYHAWNSDFLTPEFWNLLTNTHDKKTLAAFAWIFSKNGSDADIENVKKIIDNFEDERKYIIYSGLSHHNYWQTGKLEDMPASSLPKFY